MLPAVAMIALASSIKLVMVESNIIHTVMNGVLEVLVGKGKFLTVLLIYALILFLQLFIGSASAKIFLVHKLNIGRQTFRIMAPTAP